MAEKDMRKKLSHCPKQHAQDRQHGRFRFGSCVFWRSHLRIPSQTFTSHWLRCCHHFHPDLQVVEHLNLAMVRQQVRKAAGELQAHRAPLPGCGPSSNGAAWSRCCQGPCQSALAGEPSHEGRSWRRCLAQIPGNSISHDKQQ